MKFQLISKFKPTGHQPKAIQQLINGINQGYPYQTLLGLTGSGKTFTMANVIAQVQKPTLIISPNKTLCAQLYGELKEFFPNNAVEYFVSYYDYYQPEAYVASKDLYIEKDSSINDEIDRLRLSSTSSLIYRQDVIIIASVSCIYGLGCPKEYRDLILSLKQGKEINRQDIIKHLVDIQYERENTYFGRSKFRVLGDIIEIHPAYSKEIIQIELFGDTIDGIFLLESISRKRKTKLDEIVIYPAKHFITNKENLQRAIIDIKDELSNRVQMLREQGKLVEAQRLEQRTLYDLELMDEIGFCTGIENYSRHIDYRQAGESPATLIDYFPKDFLLFIDESHVSVPQIRGMYAGDQARKHNLVHFGFRLPSALDNRPLKLEEFLNKINQTIFISATPGPFELTQSKQIVEQLIRPTGLLDPKIEVRPTQGQIDDLISEIKHQVGSNERTLITTLTKKMSEELTDYLIDYGIKIRYLHCEIETIKRSEILQDLRQGKIDCIVGINLLREGLDLPEVSLVVILDADKMGFLRSERSLIQTAGRAARNVNGRVIFYANTISKAMKTTIDETNRRREIQIEYNKKHHIQPKTICKSVQEIIVRQVNLESKHKIKQASDYIKELKSKYNISIKEHKKRYLQCLEAKMFEYAEQQEFEEAQTMLNEIQFYSK